MLTVDPRALVRLHLCAAAVQPLPQFSIQLRIDLRGRGARCDAANQVQPVAVWTVAQGTLMNEVGLLTQWDPKLRHVGVQRLARRTPAP